MSNQKAAERLILKRSTAFNCQRWDYTHFDKNCKSNSFAVHSRKPLFFRPFHLQYIALLHYNNQTPKLQMRKLLPDMPGHTGL